jgi:hypothetical protein
MLNVIIFSVVILSFAMLSNIMLNFIMTNVAILNVVERKRDRDTKLMTRCLLTLKLGIISSRRVR